MHTISQSSLAGHEGVVISWVSNKDAIVVKGDAGIVTQADDNIDVNLTATITKNGKSVPKEIIVKVLAGELLSAI